MATQGLFSTFLISAPPRIPLPLARNGSKISTSTKPVQCITTPATTIDVNDQGSGSRRNANYPPSFWDYNLVKSLSSTDYTDEKYVEQVNELKDKAMLLIHADTDMPLAKLELLDSVQRLGLKYQFQKDTKPAVDAIYNNNSAHAWLSGDLYSTALRFRIFREHGYNVSQDVFQRFTDEAGNFKKTLCEDVKGLLSLYEASFLGFEGEDIIDKAKAFSTTHLKNAVKGEIISPNMARKVNHALDMPLHWRLARVEARWYIDTYEQEQNMIPNLVKLAKLDYNFVQSVYQKEVSKLASWWVDIGLQKMTFARDRLVEHHFWCNGIVSDPEYSAFRIMATKVICLITTIDDMYDVYSSLEEAELFTDYVDRWDITEIDKLPMKIKTVLFAMFNTTNEIGYWTLQERDFNILPYLSKQWAYLCKAYLKEAKWFHSGYKPTLDEYLENAAVSIGAQILLFCAYFLTAEKINVEALDYIDKVPSIMRSSCMIVRLTNDLGTSSDEMARGDNLKAVQCYMNDTGASEEVARKYVENLVHETWKILNKDLLGNYPFGEAFLAANPDMARTGQTFYQYGDGHGNPQHWTKDHLKSLLVEPFTLSQ
ncbi:Santalene synthase [Heracleum sosnowskyi]|uniref:Santalene synthase n=1 Tax=Heracleum sosnowskyi TaxID=360622 RepID=A0AAD8JMP4_9APIA|nr:Santalene synthase [Heracleum sosnowskyi]